MADGDGSRDAVVVIGASGGFGRLFCELLQSNASPVHRVDLVRCDGGPACLHPIRDAPAVADALGSSRVLLLCIDEHAVLESAPRYIPALSPGSLVVDICSTKKRVVSLISEAIRGSGVDHLSVHPMFGPSLGFQGQNVVWSGGGSSPIARRFLELLGAAGAVLHHLPPDAHDRAVVGSQVYSHVALMLFVLCNRGLEIPLSELRAVETPSSHILTALSARLSGGDPELCLSIQRAAEEDHRRLLEDVLQRILAAVRADSGEAFLCLLEEIRQWLGNDAVMYRDIAQGIMGGLSPARNGVSAGFRSASPGQAAPAHISGGVCGEPPTDRKADG